ncbi:hypothetical protein SAMN04487995_0922 [Dyadobacter koreensis]|uniref:Uncharacterized protein n=1 Tax=Dyadobacter koreensis TaxID=408657 RepID=A0A1H6QYT9_9BACT|nr:hypothetical protein [Dyadobacter koreensis]SEI46134.1 hypothetical protein SAMN04487995_0922 [Dyadobacter koreensis]
MATTTDISLIYETLLCSPGMSEQIKVDLRVSRKSLLFLAACVENELSGKNDPGLGLVGYFGEQTVKELEKLVSDSLSKADLSALNEKLKGLS